MDNQSGEPSLFGDQWKELMAKARFQPCATYIPEGDLLEVCFKEGAYYHQVVSPGITLIRDIDTDEVVGFSCHGVSRVIASGVVTLKLL